MRNLVLDFIIALVKKVYLLCSGSAKAKAIFPANISRNILSVLNLPTPDYTPMINKSPNFQTRFDIYNFDAIKDFYRRTFCAFPEFKPVALNNNNIKIVVKWAKNPGIYCESPYLVQIPEVIGTDLLLFFQQSVGRGF